MDQLGRYRLLDELGSGGFAVVYRAETVTQAGQRAEFALKWFHPNLTHEDPEFVEALVEEARICSQIRHHNVVRFHELAYEPDERGSLMYFMVMELVDGVTLEALPWMAARRQERIPNRVILDLLAQAAEGLHHVHTLQDAEGRPMGMVHRDLKPSNVLVDQAGTAKILDFGIAKALDAMGPKTATGMTRGTAAYMAPEQAFGRPVAPAADQFALGALMYYLATAEALLAANTMASELLAVVNTPPEQGLDVLQRLIPGVGPLFLRLRQHQPEDRFGSMAEVARQLRALQSRFEGQIDTSSYIWSLLDDPNVQVNRRDLGRRQRPESDDPTTLTIEQLGPEQLNREGEMVPARDAALSWGVPAEELTVADLEFLPEPGARQTSGMPSAESESLDGPILTGTPVDAVPRATSGPYPQVVTPSQQMPQAPGTPAAPTPAPSQPVTPVAMPNLPGAALQRDRGRPWALLWLLLLPLGAIVVGGTVLLLAGLWQTPPPVEFVPLPVEPASEDMGDSVVVGDDDSASGDDGITEEEAIEDIALADTAEEVLPEEPTEPPEEKPTPREESRSSRRDRDRSHREERTTPAPAVVEPDEPPQEVEEATPTETGTLKINAYPSAKVYVDGDYVGTTLETAQGIRLPAGRHQVRMVRTNDGHEQTITVRIKPRKVLAIPFEWED